MLQVTLSVLAWLSVVGFHLYVYLSLKARKLLLHDELPPFSSSLSLPSSSPSSSSYTYRVMPDKETEQHDHDFHLQELGQVVETTCPGTATMMPSEEAADDSESRYPPALVEPPQQQQYQQSHQQSHQWRAAAAAAAHLYVLPGDALDGDEPDLFFELLSQTGSEMINVRIHRRRTDWVLWNMLLLLLLLLNFIIVVVEFIIVVVVECCYCRC